MLTQWFALARHLFASVWRAQRNYLAAKFVAPDPVTAYGDTVIITRSEIIIISTILFGL